MNASAVIVPEELEFARIGCTKLANLVLGTVSVFLAALKLSNWEYFLQSQHRRISALIEVLHLVRVQRDKQEHWVGVSRSLQEDVDLLYDHGEEFFNCLRHLIPWQELTGEGIHEAVAGLAAATDQLFHSLRRLANDLNLTDDFCSQAVKCQEILEAYGSELSAMQAATTQ